MHSVDSHLRLLATSPAVVQGVDELETRKLRHQGNVAKLPKRQRAAVIITADDLQASTSSAVIDRRYNSDAITRLL